MIFSRNWLASTQNSSNLLSDWWKKCFWPRNESSFSIFCCFSLNYFVYWFVLKNHKRLFSFKKIGIKQTNHKKYEICWTDFFGKGFKNIRILNYRRSNWSSMRKFFKIVDRTAFWCGNHIPKFIDIPSTYFSPKF